MFLYITLLLNVLAGFLTNYDVFERKFSLFLLIKRPDKIF